MDHRAETVKTVTRGPADVVRELYTALLEADMPRALATLAPDLIVDHTNELPYGGVHHGREAWVESVLKVITGHADVGRIDFRIHEAGPTGAIGVLGGTLVAHTTGEEHALTSVEVIKVEDGLIRKIDVYTKNPRALAEFYTRAEAATG